MFSEQYTALHNWIKDNGKYVTGSFFAEANELSTRPANPVVIKIDASDLSDLAYDDVLNFRTQMLNYWRALFQLDTYDKHAPFNVETHDVIVQEFEGVQYEIEVLSWDAYPGFSIPCHIYRPVVTPTKKFPAIISVMGCQTNIATHNDSFSAQRLAANWALKGLLVMTIGTGQCYDGIIGETFGNSFAYEQLGRLSGSGFCSLSIGISMLKRAVDYLLTREDVDPNCIAATGYSYGGGLATYLASYDDRLAALGLAATSFFAPAEIDQRICNMRRLPAVSTGSSDIYINGDLPPKLGFDVPFPTHLRLSFGASVIAPKKFYIVQGRDDPGTSISDMQALLGEMTAIGQILAPGSLPPTMDIVDGDHNFNAERRRLVGDWFMRIFGAKPLLQNPDHAFEYDTPVLPRKTIERPSKNFGTIVLRDIHANYAKTFMQQYRTIHNIVPATTIDKLRQLTQKIFLLPDETEKNSARPIMLDERNFRLTTSSISAKFWWVPLSKGIRASVLTLTPEKSIHNTGQPHIVVMTNNEVIPPEELISQAFNNHASCIAIVYVPAFLFLRSTQLTTGEVALRSPGMLGRTLLGMGVESIRAGLDLLAILLRKEIQVVASGIGFDASHMLLYTSVLDPRISKTYLNDFIKSYEDFLTSPELPTLAPSMAATGLYTYMDIPDVINGLQANNQPVHVMSYSNLKEFILDLRPAV